MADIVFQNTALAINPGLEDVTVLKGGGPGSCATREEKQYLSIRCGPKCPFEA
jgi:hypothetical protein